jgi:hypothetical protein
MFKDFFEIPSQTVREVGQLKRVNDCLIFEAFDSPIKVFGALEQLLTSLLGLA